MAASNILNSSFSFKNQVFDSFFFNFRTNTKFQLIRLVFCWYGDMTTIFSETTKLGWSPWKIRWNVWRTIMMMLGQIICRRWGYPVNGTDSFLIWPHLTLTYLHGFLFNIREFKQRWFFVKMSVIFENPVLTILRPPGTNWYSFRPDKNGIFVWIHNKFGIWRVFISLI